jgi:hypothetical protein
MAIIKSDMWKNSRVVNNATSFLPEDAVVTDVFAKSVDCGDIVLVRGGDFDEKTARKLIHFRDEGAVVVSYRSKPAELKRNLQEATARFFW